MLVHVATDTTCLMHIAYDRSISYIVLFGLFGNILRWSYGYSLLTEDSNTSSFDKSIAAGYRYGTDNILSQSVLSTDSVLESQVHTASEETHLLQKNYTIFTKTTVWSRLRQLGRTIQTSMTKPLLAALLALVIAFIPSLQTLLFAKDSFLHGSVIIPLKNCGSASVPLVLVCLGAQLSTISFERVDPASQKVVSMAVISRMILSPLITIPLLTAIHVYGQNLIGLAADPAFLVVLGLLSAMPTAIGLTQIAQAGRAEDLLLRALFWGYGIFCLPICMLSVLSLLAILDVIR